MIYQKYYLWKEQVSLDGGETWEDTGNETPSGDPIASYSTLEECEGITACTCSAFTYSPTSVTVSSAATAVSISYTGCSELSLSSAETYNWVAIGSHTYNTATTVGSVSANISANTSSSRSATLTFSLNGSTCQDIYITQESGEEPQPTCNCDSFVFEGVEETEPSIITITLLLNNNGSTPLSVGTMEIFTTMGSVQVPVSDTIAAGSSKSITVSNYTEEGNSVTRVEGTIDNVSHCFEFECPSSGCDLGEGDTLTVKLGSITSCS